MSIFLPYQHICHPSRPSYPFLPSDHSNLALLPYLPPPQVIRPRLQGSMMLRVTTMEILKLTYWDPARDMRSVLLDIKVSTEQAAPAQNTWLSLITALDSDSM